MRNLLSDPTMEPSSKDYTSIPEINLRHLDLEI
ncbi:hypothetical protein J2X97_000806 [Epilithonimonas hungarica]|nr:hypothetical protein [Epilithonimonas hungarica]